MGGAARFLGELDRFLAKSGRVNVAVIGRGQPLTLDWLARREQQADRKVHRIATNNVGFLTPGGPRTVQLRNALHFATDTELASLKFRLPRTMGLQAKVVRTACRWADRIVVPCAAMAERVSTFLPSVAGHLVVRAHPVTPKSWAGSTPLAGELLLPILNAPYKRLSWHVENILEAASLGDSLKRVHVTAEPNDFPSGVQCDPRVNFIGRLSPYALDHYWERSRAIYFPTEIESFGYPLAEARANGRRVVALDTDQNREIAGNALSGFTLGSAPSLAAALEDAMSVTVGVDCHTFDPECYFSYLFEGSHA
jgi:glycosyltransferase involved in cell wall biosynthesis